MNFLIKLFGYSKQLEIAKMIYKDYEHRYYQMHAENADRGGMRYEMPRVKKLKLKRRNNGKLK